MNYHSTVSANSKFNMASTSIWFMIYAFLFMSLIPSVTGAPIDTEAGSLAPNEAVTSLKASTMEDAIDFVSAQVMANNANNDSAWIVQLPDKVPVFISNFTLEDTATNVTLGKRWDSHNAPLGASWTQHQVVRQGEWWGKWYPKSCAIGNSLSDRDTTWEITSESSYSKSVSAGFSMGAAESAAVSMSVSVTSTNTQSYKGVFVIPAHGWGQVWTRQRMIWQDQQQQSCHKYNYGKNGIKCGAWSAYIHGDVPVKNGAMFTWSTGYENMDMNNCGGGNAWQL
ncbi:hypothetical protein KDRO_A07650 [Kluyveromyces lactis]|nr:hypothetical protein KDRO_A07650 [Kluyveromyces lactis]